MNVHLICFQEPDTEAMQAVRDLWPGEHHFELNDTQIPLRRHSPWRRHWLESVFGSVRVNADRKSFKEVMREVRDDIREARDDIKAILSRLPSPEETGGARERR